MYFSGGDPLWFSPLAGDTIGFTAIQGVLCVANTKDRSVNLLNKTGEHIGHHLNKDRLTDSPFCSHYDDSSQTFFVAYDGKCVIRDFHIKT